MKIIVILFAVFCLTAVSIAQTADYHITDWHFRVSFLYSYFHFDSLGYNMQGYQSLWQTRGRYKKCPGDYFAEPGSIKYTYNKMLSDSVRNILIENVSFDIPVSLTDSIKWFRDSSESGLRDDFFLRFTDQSHVYVISGWWPAFVKYFVAVPDSNIYTEKALIGEFIKIYKHPLPADSLRLKRASDSEYSLLKGTFRNLQIRNYNIKAFSIEGRSQAPDLGQPPPMFSDWYNIIEITIYLDKEFMP
jgi:hypothetical protein